MYTTKTYAVYWKMWRWDVTGLVSDNKHGLEWISKGGNGLIEITLDLNGVEWKHMKHYRLNWPVWISIDWKVMEHKTVAYYWKDGLSIARTETEYLHYIVVSCYALYFGLYIYCTLSLVLSWWMRCKQQIHRFDLELQVTELRTMFQVKKTDYSYLGREVKNQCGVTLSCHRNSSEWSPESLSTQ